MSKLTPRLTVALAFVVLTIAGCGGGSSGSGPTPAGPQPTPTPASGPSAAPGSATFTLYTATVDGQAIVSMMPVGAGAPDSAHTWTAAAGAEIIYPDKSVQVADANGSFDASKATWTSANAAVVALNPNASPQLRIVVASGATPAVPLFTSVLPLNLFDSVLPSTGISSNFRDLVVVPSTAGMFNDEVRVYEAVGQDLIGGLIDVAPAVRWSLQLPAGCPGTPAGSLVIDPLKASIVTYKPSATRTFTGNCYDEVVASIANLSAPVSATANAVYFATSQGIPITGKVVTAAGAPVANGLVDFYGGSGVLGFGDFLAATNASGTFARNVPPLRPLIPFADNFAAPVTAPIVSAYTVAPANIAVGPPGARPPATTLTEGAPFVNPYTPLPPAAFTLTNSYDIGNAALLDVPFGLPNASGVLPNCSVGAFISGQSTVQSCSGLVKDGSIFRGWLVTVAPDAATGGNDFTFLEPEGTPGGQQVLAVGTNVVSYTAPNGSGLDPTAPQCSSATPCASYVRYFNPNGLGVALPAPLVPANLPAGTVLQIDGVFTTLSQAPNYNVNLIRNVYSGSFPTLGQPQRAHAEAFQYQFGATTVAFTDHWYNSVGLQGGNFSFSRAATSTGYTLTGGGTQMYFRAAFAPTSITYTLSNGAVNLMVSPVAETYTVASTGPNVAPLTISWTWSGIAGVGSTASGTVANTANQPVATFVVSAAGDVTLTESAANGGGIQQFPL